jgi:translocation and assembly module TamB
MTDQTQSQPTLTPEPAGWPLYLRILFWLGMAVLGLIVLLIIALNLPFTRQWAFDYARTILADAGVQSSGISGTLGEMTLRDVALTDDEGVWATANEIVVSWSPFSLVSGAVYADRIEMKGARLLRDPAYAPAPDQVDEPFAWPDLPVDIALDSLIGDVTIDPSIIGEAITANLTGKASLTSSGGSAEINITRSDGVEGTAAVTVSTNAKLDDISLQVNAKDARIVSVVATDPRLANLEIALQGSRRGTVCSGQASISARDGALATAGVDDKCSFAITLTDVAKLLDAGMGVSGPANVTLQLLEDGSDETTQVQVSADLSQLVSSDAMYARVIPGASANALVTIMTGSVRVENLQAQLASGKVGLTGWVVLENERLQALADLNATDLAALRPDLKGRANARLTYDTASATPIAFQAAGSDIAAGDLRWSSFATNGGVDAAGTGQVTIKAAGPAPIDLTANIKNAFGGGLVADVTGSAVSAQISLKAAETAAAAYDVAATIDTTRLDLLGDLLGQDLAGTLNASASGRVGGIPGAVKLDVKLTGARYGVQKIGDATLSANGPLTNLAVILTGRAPVADRTIEYRVAAAIANFSSARISELRAATANERIEATGPFTVSFGSGLAVDGLTARLSRAGKAAGEIAASATQSATGIKTSARLSGIDLEALMAVLGRDAVKGRLDATADLDGGAGRATLSGRIANLSAGGQAGRVPPANVAIDGTWSGGQVRTMVVIRAEGLPDARAEISFPMARAAGGGIPSPAPNAALNGTISWTGRIAPIWRLADIDGHTLDGDADVQATIRGTISAPVVAGDFAIRNGSYLNEAFGTRLSALNVSGRMAGEQLTVTGSATDGGRGRMDIDAAMQLSGGLGGASGGVTLKSMQLLASDTLSARIDGGLKLAPGANGPVLGGNLTITGLEAGIPAAAPPDLVVIDVIDPAAPPPPPQVAEPRSAERDAPAAASGVLGLNITVDIPGPAAVQGRGIDSLWRGRLAVGGDISDPRVSGRLNLLRGTIEFGSRSFVLSEGEILFDGGPSIDPRIKIVATQTDEDFTATLTLEGRPDTLTITASSVPAAPQDEVFARLLFGRSVTDLTPLEGLELANSIATISGATGGTAGLLGGLKDRFGLDVLTVEGLGDEGGPTVKAGSYLADNVYFELKQGGSSGGTTGRLEYQIDENFSVETEIGADSSGAVGGRYKIDY